MIGGPGIAAGTPPAPAFRSSSTPTRWDGVGGRTGRCSRTRYLAEPVIGAPARQLAHDAKAIQDELGTIQDTVVLLDLLDSAAVPAAAGGPVRALYAQQQRVLHEASARAARLRL